MNTNQPENRKNSPEKPFSAGEIVLLVLSVLLLSCGLFVFGWYGSTYIPLRHTSEIHAKDLVIRAGGQQCTLEIPSGKLSIRRPSRAVVGSKYHAEADVVWAQPLRFKDCSGGIPNWDINLEAQIGFVGSEVIPFSAIRQPVFNRNDFSFQWTFTPQETVAEYPSHFYLRVYAKYTVIRSADRSLVYCRFLFCCGGYSSADPAGPEAEKNSGSDKNGRK